MTKNVVVMWACSEVAMSPNHQLSEAEVAIAVVAFATTHASAAGVNFPCPSDGRRLAQQAGSWILNFPALCTIFRYLHDFSWIYANKHANSNEHVHKLRRNDETHEHNLSVP